MYDSIVRNEMTHKIKQGLLQVDARADEEIKISNSEIGCPRNKKFKALWSSLPPYVQSFHSLSREKSHSNDA